MDRRGIYLFEDTLSWLDLGLQVLCRTGWRPECSQPQEVNIARILPPDALRARFFPGEYPPKPKRDINKERGKSLQKYLKQDWGMEMWG